jgi:polyribonucleotide nucleotidyltransferase
MIGHGALAEKALKPVIPTKEVFPYTIRVVSESMASNGSTSMASVCASTVALMDGGVPIKNPVAGIAMGLMLNEEKAASGNVEGEYKILTDIQGPEDHHGDMDFKVAGTRDGVTAVQMDVKISGVPLPILIEAFEEAKRARITILDRIEEEIKTPRESISPHAPKIVTTTIKPDQIGMVIGPGGKVVNKIREDTGTEIEIDDDGTIFITGKGDGPDRAKETISEMTREYVSGDKFEGEVTRIMNFGAFVKIGHNTEGLVHVSEIAPFRVESVEEVLKTGEAVPVVVKEIDDQGRINLSIKAVDPDFLTKKGIKPKTNNDKTNS